MNKIFFIILLIIQVLLFTSCEYDNYNPPMIKLSGKIAYNGNALCLKNGQILLSLYEEGWPLKANEQIAVDQNGEFNALVYPGKYKLMRTVGVGPWKDATSSSDTLVLDISRDTNIDMNVSPFYIIETPQITYTTDKDSISATFKLTRVSPANVEKIGLYIGRLQILDITNNSGVRKELRLIDGVKVDDINTIKVALSDALKIDTYLFARIGVKTSGRGELIYSPVIKIQK